jgi:hypothetical protein
MNALQHIATRNRIIDRLDKCTTAAEVATVANEEREAVVSLQKIPDARVYATHITNMKHRVLWEIANPL